MNGNTDPRWRAEITGMWDYATVPDGVVLGTGCFLERKDSFLRYRSERRPGLILGDGVHVSTWTEFNLEPTGRVEVGDGSVLVGAIFMCAESISIGRDVVISYHVTIADCDFHPKDLQARRLDAAANAPLGDKSQRPALVTRPVLIGDGAWIGIGATILQGVTVGANARVGPGAVVTNDVAPGGHVVGNPARPVERLP